MDHYKLICVHYKHLNLQLWYTAPLYKMTCMVTWPNENSIRLGKWGMRLGNMHRSIYHWVLTSQKGFIFPPSLHVYRCISLHVYHGISPHLSQEPEEVGCGCGRSSWFPSLCKDRVNAAHQSTKLLLLAHFSSLVINMLIQVSHTWQDLEHPLIPAPAGIRISRGTSQPALTLRPFTTLHFWAQEGLSV